MSDSQEPPSSFLVDAAGMDGRPVVNDPVISVVPAATRLAASRGRESEPVVEAADPAELRPSKPASLRDVARLAKVSVATVSMVLNN
ncbi:MAG: LacI family DNA-binding transcriptional regulator, partial [Phycisphaerae bacterium]